MTQHLMEEHHEAYFTWKRLEIANAWCWHIDAHLDIGREGLNSQRLKILEGCSTSGQALERGASGNCYLPWGGLHCGNYLYPAIVEGIVARLTWVIPPYLPQSDLLDWTRRHLDGWFELTLDDCATFEVHDGYVRGEALGIVVEVGTWENLESLRREALGGDDRPLLLDVDIDYFLQGDGEPWQQPQALAQETQTWNSSCTTVALSVKGGYTPTVHREFAQAFLAAPMEPGYVGQALDQAAAVFRCHLYDQALRRFERLTGEAPVEASYYLGSCHQKLKHLEQALQFWEPLCTHPEVPDDGRSYLRGLCGELCIGLQRPEQAIEHAAAGKKLAPGDYRHPWTEAVAKELQGDLKGSIRLVRRALRLAEGTLFSLKIRLALARIYRRLGNRELSRMELQRLAALDVSNEYRASTALV